MIMTITSLYNLLMNSFKIMFLKLLINLASHGMFKKFPKKFSNVSFSLIFIHFLLARGEWKDFSDLEKHINLFFEFKNN